MQCLVFPSYLGQMSLPLISLQSRRIVRMRWIPGHLGLGNVYWIDKFSAVACIRRELDSVRYCYSFQCHLAFWNVAERALCAYHVMHVMNEECGARGRHGYFTRVAQYVAWVRGMTTRGKSSRNSKRRSRVWACDQFQTSPAASPVI